MQDSEFFQKNGVAVGEQLGGLFDDLPGFIYFVKDLDFRYVAFNKRLEEIFEVGSGAEILGKKDDDFLPPQLLKAIRKDDIKVIESGESMLNKVELVPRGNGFVDWSNTTKRALKNAEGKVCGIVGVTRPFGQGTTTIIRNEELGPALKVMHDTFRENILISDLADQLNISLSTFLRKFKSCFGMTPKEYIRHLRVQEACHQIVQTTHSLAQVSYDCGFADQSHFSREFSRVMKESPSSYRSRFRVK